jgi:hypothetical protein
MKKLVANFPKVPGVNGAAITADFYVSFFTASNHVLPK